MREAISDEGGNQWQSEHDSYLRTRTQSKCTRTQLKINQTQSNAIRVLTWSRLFLPRDRRRAAWPPVRRHRAAPPMP